MENNMKATLVITKDNDQSWVKVFLGDNPYPIAQVLLADHYHDDGSPSNNLSVTIRDWANVTKEIEYPVPA